MKKILIAAVAGLLVVAASSAALSDAKKRTFNEKEMKKMADSTAVIHTNFGDIELKFFPETAPGHVKNFIDLAEKKFYDGTIFHRIIPNFMVQGGDPNTKSEDRSSHGTGGPGYTIKAEFSKKSHKKGTLSMARSQHPDSAGSQFFVVVSDSTFLDKQYTAFGRVVRGMEVADAIVAAPRDGSDNPNERIEMKVKVVEPG